MSLAAALIAVLFAHSAQAVDQDEIRALNLVAVGGDRVVHLSWQAVKFDQPIRHFKMYRGVCSGCERYVASIPADRTSADDWGLTNGRIYHYRLTVVTMSGEESDRSNEARGVPIGRKTRLPIEIVRP